MRKRLLRLTWFFGTIHWVKLDHGRSNSDLVSSRGHKGLLFYVHSLSLGLIGLELTIPNLFVPVVEES